MLYQHLLENFSTVNISAVTSSTPCLYELQKWGHRKIKLIHLKINEEQYIIRPGK